MMSCEDSCSPSILEPNERQKHEQSSTTSSLLDEVEDLQEDITKKTNKEGRFR